MALFKSNEEENKTTTETPTAVETTENTATEEPKQEENKTEEKIESDKVTEKEPPEKEENTAPSKRYGIVENKSLLDCIKQEDVYQRTPVYNMLSALESSKHGETFISYEQSITYTKGENTIKKYFVVDTSPLEINNKISGFVIMFKDITQLRESMKKLQDSQERLMEQERFAFLGQMIGGLAHNLKTPIMSISGCVNASEALLEECEESLGDEEVTKEDFLEIYGEMRDWLKKVKESTAYMSDIITAIKGQAANIEADEKVTFTIDQMIKRSVLLMRHELLNSGCKLKVICDESENISLQGDINNLVQVIGNLLSEPDWLMTSSISYEASPGITITLSPRRFDSSSMTTSLSGTS